VEDGREVRTSVLIASHESEGRVVPGLGRVFVVTGTGLADAMTCRTGETIAEVSMKGLVQKAVKAVGAAQGSSERKFPAVHASPPGTIVMT
jgi:hypothetical protein